MTRKVTLDATEYQIELTGLDWDGAGLRVGGQDGLEVPTFDADSNFLTLVFSDGNTHAKKLELCMLMRETTTVLWRLLVPRNERGKGLGRFGFDVYRVYAVFREVTPSGRIGGGMDTQEFLEAVGVPPDDIEGFEDELSAMTTFTTDLEALQDVEYADITFRRM